MESFNERCQSSTRSHEGSRSRFSDTLTLPDERYYYQFADDTLNRRGGLGPLPSARKRQEQRPRKSDPVRRDQSATFTTELPRCPADPVEPGARSGCPGDPGLHTGGSRRDRGQANADGTLDRGAQRGIAATLVVATLVIGTAGPARAEPDPLEPRALLRARGGDDLELLWVEAEALERRGRGLELDEPERAVAVYLEAARLFETVRTPHPGFSVAYWRAARSFWLAGDTLDLEAKAGRIEYFQRAETLSDQGVQLDPGCAECMLWKFASMGRLRTTRGVWTGLRQLPEMAALLERGIELAPTTTKGADDSTLGNLHYSSAIFYRIFPDWFWIGWLLGVQGDKERALRHIETALALHPQHLDYQVELGSQPLCLGSVRDDPVRLDRGEAVMRAALERETQTQLRHGG